jgi:molybdopterin/thiamine biosynthesis adenylyltransferase
MDTSRHDYIFDYNKQSFHKIHIIGCGAIGSKAAIELTRLGCSNFVLWDEDEVSEVNITNQAFFDKQIGKKKTEAIVSQMIGINPNVKITTKGFFTEENADTINEEPFIVFALPDSMKVRKLIWDTVKLNKKCFYYIETRIGLWNFHVYSVNPMESNEISEYEQTLYSDEEASEREVSPCGTPLTMGTLTSLVSTIAVSNYMNYWLKNEEYKGAPNEIMGSLHPRIIKNNGIQLIVNNY